MRVLIKVFSRAGSELVEYTVLERYEDSVLAIPYGYNLLMEQCEGKPTLFHESQVKGYIEDENNI